MIDVGVAPRPVVRASARSIDPPVAKTRPRPSLPSLIVLVIAFAVTAVSAFVTRAVTNSTEDRLLRLQTRQAGAVLRAVLPSIQTPLASAAAISASSGDSVRNFRRYAAGYVGTGRTFVSVSLWRLGPDGPRAISTVGTTPRVDPARAATFVRQAAGDVGLHVIGLLSGSNPRLGYAYTAGRATPLVVYAESALPPHRRIVTAPGSPFAELRFALYLGAGTQSRSLLETNVDTLPLTGRTNTTAVAFGSSTLTLVATSAGDLGGRFTQWRWRSVALVGVLIALAAALMTDRLVKRRRAAEVLTAEVETLLQDQRTIAQTLQRALRPGTLPSVPGLQIAARYLPGVKGIEIGGDWYDVIAIDDTQFFFVVGDVSGRGLGAGSIMASLHFAIRGYVTEGHDPAAVLTLLGRLLDLTRDKHFATVLCGHVDVLRQRLTLANAGHLPPLLINEDGSNFVATQVGPPIGVVTRPTYAPVTVDLRSGTTLFAFTDGLVERRDENLDEGLARLRDCVPVDGDLDAALTAMVDHLMPDGSEDDTALLGLRWT